MKRVFITGGAGFIGSHLGETFLLNGYQVWVYDNLTKGKKKFLPKDSRLTFIKGDILNLNLLLKSITKYKPDLLYHLAALHYIPACDASPQQTLRVNIEGSLNTLTACFQNKVKKFIFASSGAIYATSDKSLKESYPLVPRDIYGISKVAGENLIEIFSQNNKTNYLITRLFNVVGMRETNPHLIPTIINQIKSGKRVIKLGNTHTKRDYIHVQDVAEALYLLGLSKQQKNLETVNIGSGVEYSVSKVIKMIGEISKVNFEVKQLPKLKRKVDRLNQLANINKIQKMINWKPKRSLRIALEDIINNNLP